jgi:transposase-like protein
MVPRPSVSRIQHLFAEIVVSRISKWQRAPALKLLRAGMTRSAVADEVGIGADTVAKLARLYRIPARKGGPNLAQRAPEEIRRKAVQMIRQGMTLRAVGGELGVSHEIVNVWARATGVESARSRRTFAIQRRRGADMLQRGATLQEVARALGVTDAAARMWKKAAGIGEIAPEDRQDFERIPAKRVVRTGTSSSCDPDDRTCSPNDQTGSGCDKDRRAMARAGSRTAARARNSTQKLDQVNNSRGAKT